jgi:tetratricopeptide (TPR) repeat protein
LLVVGLALMLALLGVGGVAAKLWYDQMAAQDALLAAVGALGATVSPDLADTLNPRIAEIRTAASTGRYAEATSRLRHILDGTRPGAPAAGELGGPLDARGAGSGAGPLPQAEQPPQGAQLPPGVVEFFQKHEKLGALFIRGNELAAKLRDSGGDVTHLRELRNRIIEAARLNDEAAVLKLLEQFRDELQKQGAKLQGRQGRPGSEGPGRPGPGGRGRPAGAPPPAFLALLRQVDGAMRKAQAEGRDLRRPMQLLREAETLARGRNFSGASRLYREALEAARTAPQLPPEPRLFQNPLVAMFLNLLQVEDQELAGTLDNLRKTYAAAKEDLSREWSQALEAAVNVLERVGARRRAFGERLEQIRTGKVTSEDLRRAQEAAREKAREEARAELEAILERVQAMKPEEFAAQRAKLVEEILQVVFGPPKPSAQKPPTMAPPTATPSGSAEQRVREKLLQAAAPFLKVQADPAQKQLADRLNALFRQARELLAAGKAEEAEKLVDQAVEQLQPKTQAPQTPQTP